MLGRRLGCEPAQDAERLAPVTAQLDAYFAGDLRELHPRRWTGR